MKITVTHEIDAEAWSEEWCVPLNEVREDAKNYILNGVAAHLDELELSVLHTLRLSSEKMPEPLAAPGWRDRPSSMTRRLWK
jgi:hypothetical protein